FRGRVGWLVVLGTPGAAYFAAGADDVVVPGEPELLFRRLRAVLERLDLVSRVERLNERVTALEAGLADAAHDVRSPLQAVIGNAIRFSPRGGVVEVEAWRASPRFVRLSVKDQGDGIAPAELPKLIAGLGPGRGLRIAREIAERHGGEIWAESSAGNGSRFFIE